MKRKSLNLFVFFISIYYINAQDITFGITGGVNYSNIGTLYHLGSSNGGGSGVIPADDTYYSANNDMGYQFGGYLKINMNYFYLRPEVVVYSLKNSYDLATKTSNWTQEGMDIGLYFGYRMLRGITIYAGPSLSTISDRQLEGMEDTGYNDPWTYEKTSLGGGIGVTLEYGRFGIDIRYLYGFTEVEELKIDMIRDYNGYGTNLAYLQAYNPSRFVLSFNIDLFSFGGEKKSKHVKSDWRNHRNL